MWFFKKREEKKKTYFECKKCGKEDWYWTDIRELCLECKHKVEDKIEKKKREAYLKSICPPNTHNYLPINGEDTYYDAICSKCGDKI